MMASFDNSDDTDAARLQQPLLAGEEDEPDDNQEEELAEMLESVKGQPSITPDGSQIALYSNSGLVQDITPALLAGAEGVGLYRTELPFMLQERFPSEEEQRSI